MARFSLSFLTVFLVLASCAMSLPTKRDDSKGLGLDTTLEGLESATKLMNGLNNKDTNNKNNQAAHVPAEDGDSDADDQEADDEQDGEDSPTPTQKKPTSGNFQTPTATTTHHPSSQPNALGGIPIIGGLLGGTGGPL
ncbi:hypothetical protein N7462_006419 [Penicillium macrosclerotiorum]|uniref:uncharacterized protein n=1 Tax=Penicillium macrosclerotiorum TaxID=303699 RepID=UPI0025473604|nr:uncharacterized protein N7462_006419 [Penicillium macrosclerotiorum]KAJ5683254.1 hypothetical protein N7462_006419 [Penicillium macrosclerotiorum]